MLSQGCLNNLIVSKWARTPPHLSHSEANAPYSPLGVKSGQALKIIHAVKCTVQYMHGFYSYSSN